MADKVLSGLEEVFSFAKTISPLFGIITTLVGVVKKGLVKDEAHKLDKDFQKIHNKLQSISEQNKQLLDQIHIEEINKNYGGLEKNIETQYRAFLTMVEQTRKDPENGEQYKEDFKTIYTKQKGRLNLNEYYRAIMEDQGPVGRPLLKDYLEHCKKNRKFMEAKCAHLVYLFHIGLMALMAYYAITEDDEEEFMAEWVPRVKSIQSKMQEALDECIEE